MDYPIEIATHNSAGIRSEAGRAGITHMREVARGEHRGSRTMPGSRATLYAMYSPGLGAEIRVLDTNGDPVWEEQDQADFAEALAYYGIDAGDDEADILVAASVATPSACLPGGTDVEVTVTLPDGREVEGGVTLVADDCDGRPRAYGDSADTWVEGRLLVVLRAAAGGDGARLAEWLRTIAGDAAAAVPGWWGSDGRWEIDPAALSPEARADED